MIFSDNDYLLFDGGFGTMVQAMNLPPAKTPEMYNISHPDAIRSIHRAYKDAGADVITANTFGASRFKLPEDVLPSDIIRAAVSLAKSVSPRYVALDIGPLGVLTEPVGTLTFEEAYDAFKEQVIAGAAAGADLIIIETMSDLLECKAAILAAKENTDLPVFATMTFAADGRTFLGTSAQNAAISLCAFGADAVGLNCSLGPRELLPLVRSFVQFSRVPVIVQANAGLPREENGVAIYDISPQEYTEAASELLNLGVRVLGGCCGTTPTYIASLRALLDSRTYAPPTPEPITAITSSTQVVMLGTSTITVAGERINPTGKPKLKEALRSQNYDYILKEAIAQEDAGADVLDVNAGIPDIDEISVLPLLVRKLREVTALPLQLDSSNPDALKAAVRIYAGKPIINSVNGKEESLSAVLPIAKKYGACLIGLTLDEKGVPKTAEQRFEIAQRIVRRAEAIGIPKEDLIIDCLVLTAATDQSQVPETLRAISMVKSRLGVKTILGVSNVSFGLPDRDELNAAYLAAAWGAGLSMAILNPISPAYQAILRDIKALNGQDLGSAQYIEYKQTHRTESVLPEKKMSSSSGDTSKPYTLQDLIIKGMKNETAAATETLLQTQSAEDIISGQFVPALDAVGAQYEKGRLFLPQLIAAAEAVKQGFDVLKRQAGGKKATREKIIIATVHGDVHDIGKNIVRMLLENYGFQVIDLGKDVPCDAVVKAATEEKVRLVGLSALMTTTVKAMEETIAQLKAACPDVRVMVGGAVLTQSYADKIGADYYAKDAAESVKIAKEVFGE